MINEEIAFFSDWAKMRDSLPDADEIETGELSLRLRRMLIDGNSLLNIVNRKYRKKVRFPSPPLDEVRLSSRIVLYFFSRDLLSNDTGRSSNLTTFLSHRIVEIDEKQLSIAEVIKLVANNLGGVHFDHEAANRLVQFDFKNAHISAVLCMAIYHIAKATSAVLKEIADLCSPFPDYSHFLGHYSSGDEGASYIQFESHQWMEVNYVENTLTSAISVLSVLEPLPQKHDTAFLFSFDFRDSSYLDISITRDGDFGLCYLKGKNKLELILEDSRKTRPIGKQIFLKASIEKNGLNTRLELGVHGRGKTFTFEYPVAKFDLKRFVLGARRNGELGAGFLEKETCILSTSDPKIQESIIKYFSYRYF